MTVGEKAVYGSGSGTVLQTETILADDSGRAVAKITANTFFVGTKCFDAVGVPRKFTRPVPSDRAPDFIVEEATTPEQAALYRLSGDYNPLHIDPDIASAFGYERPIQHGLCTLGFATRLVSQTCGNNEGSRLSKVACRFSKPTYPGRVLVVEMWKVGSHSVSFRVKDKEAGVVVLDHAYVNFGFKSATAKL
jgi:3-hydroxyacyl-CoA dehydrogenase/3a,7a,12a-trihydroxy-5b-cholest-24-enoyl-CoA hydratase